METIAQRMAKIMSNDRTNNEGEWDKFRSSITDSYDVGDITVLVFKDGSGLRVNTKTGEIRTGRVFEIPVGQEH